MIITKLSVKRDKDSSKIVLMNLTFEEAIITKSEVTPIDAKQLEDGTTTEQGSPPNKRGRQETITPTVVTETSVLKSVLNWIGI